MKKFALLICMWMALIVPGHFIANAQPTNISVINTGAANNDKTGDTLRIAFGKINTNFYYLTNLVRTITNSIGSVANITSITNRIDVQQTALAGLTNSQATKQLGSAALTNLSAEVNVATNIIGAGFGITVSSNNAGTWTITGATTNYISTTNGTAYALTVNGLFSSTNVDAKISSASNTVHTALIATNTLLFTNIFSLNTAANNNAANVTSISNRVIQAEVTNAVQQTTLAGLTDSIANLNTNYIATTNGMSRNLTNLGAAYSDRLVVTNLIVGTNANIVVVSNGNIITTGNITVSGSSYVLAHTIYAGSTVNTPTIYSSGVSGNFGGLIRFDGVNEVGVIQLRDRNDTTFGRLIFGPNNTNFPALKRNGASLEIVDALGNSRATNNLIVPGVVISTNGFILPASTPFTAPNSLSGHGGHLWSDGTNLSVVLQNSIGARTTNNIITSSGTNYIATTNGMSRNLTNLGQAYSDRLVVTNLIVGTNASTVQITNGTIIATGTISITAPADNGHFAAGTYGAFRFGNGIVSTISWDSRSYGAINLFRADLGRFSHLNWGHENHLDNIATLYTGIAGSDMTLMNGGLNFSTSTNKLTVPRFQVSSNSFSAIITNIMTTNVVWDFPSTGIGAVADLGATITGVKDGDEVIVSPPQAAMTSIIGSYSGFASNGVAYGRFLPLGGSRIGTADQNPASGTFRVVVTQYK